MPHELNALRTLEREVASYIAAMGFSSNREALQNALDAVRQARGAKAPDLGSADAYGELLRGYSFVGDGLGCYSVFDVCVTLQPVNPASPLGLLLLRHLFADCSPEYAAANVARAHLYASPTRVVAWYWDGDGTLLIGDRVADGSVVRMARNTDCKHNHGWEWLAVEPGWYQQFSVPQTNA